MSDFRPDSLLILEAHDAVLRDKRASMKPNEFICGICERVSERTKPYYSEADYESERIVCNGASFSTSKS